MRTHDIAAIAAGTATAAPSAESLEGMLASFSAALAVYLVRLAFVVIRRRIEKLNDDEENP